MMPSGRTRIKDLFTPTELGWGEGEVFARG